MTLLETIEEEKKQAKKEVEKKEETKKDELSPAQVIQWLVGVIQLAAAESRLACGLDGCVEYLQSVPTEVMLCVLPGSAAKGSVDVNIEHLLIKAFCVEHFIHVMTVDCATKLTKLIIHCYQQLIQAGRADVSMPPVPENSPGFTCVLIKYAKESSSKDQAMLGRLFQPKPQILAPPTPSSTPQVTAQMMPSKGASQIAESKTARVKSHKVEVEEEGEPWSESLVSQSKPTAKVEPKCTSPATVEAKYQQAGPDFAPNVLRTKLPLSYAEVLHGEPKTSEPKFLAGMVQPTPCEYLKAGMASSKVEMPDSAFQEPEASFQEFEPDSKLNMSGSKSWKSSNFGQPLGCIGQQTNAHSLPRLEIPLFKPKRNIFVQPYVELPE